MNSRENSSREAGRLEKKNEEYSDFFKRDFRDRFLGFVRRWLTVGAAAISLFMVEHWLAPVKNIFAREKQRIEQEGLEAIEPLLARELEKKLFLYFYKLKPWLKEGIEWDQDRILFLQSDFHEAVAKGGLSEFVSRRVEVILDKTHQQGKIFRNESDYAVKKLLPYWTASREILEISKQAGADTKVPLFLAVPSLYKIRDNSFLLKIALLDQSRGEVYLGDKKVINLDIGRDAAVEVAADISALVDQAAEELLNKVKNKEVSPVAEAEEKVFFGKSSFDNEREMFSLSDDGWKWQYPRTDLILFSSSDRPLNHFSGEYLSQHPDYIFQFTGKINDLPISLVWRGRDLLSLGKELQLSPYVEEAKVFDEEGKLAAEFDLFAEIAVSENKFPSVVSLKLEGGEEIEVARYDEMKVRRSNFSGYDFCDILEPGRQEWLADNFDFKKTAEQLDKLHQLVGKKVVRRFYIFLIRGGEGGHFDKSRDSLAVFIDPDKYEKLLDLSSAERQRIFNFTVSHELAHAIDNDFKITEEDENNHLQRYFLISKWYPETRKYVYNLAEEKMNNDEKLGGHPWDSEAEFFASLFNSLFYSEEVLQQKDVNFLAWYNGALISLAARLQQIDKLSNKQINQLVADKIKQVEEVIDDKEAEEGRLTYLFYPLLNDNIFEQILVTNNKKSQWWLYKHFSRKLEKLEKESFSVDKRRLGKVRERLARLYQGVRDRS